MIIHQPEYYENIEFENSGFPFRLFTAYGLTTHPHWHINSELIYVEKGELTLYINGEPINCSKGEIQYIPPNYLHSVLANKNCKYNVLVIGKDFISGTNEDLLIKPLKSIFSGEVNTKSININSGCKLHILTLPIIKNIIEENTTKDIFHQVIIKTSIIKFFSLFIRFNSDLQQPNKPPISSQLINIKNAIDYVSKNYMNKISIENISNQFGLSEQHFCRLFKHFTGKTFIEHLTHYRLEQSKNLLLNTDLPISRIPELTGFCNPCYFSRVYKKHYGVSPIKNRKQVNTK